MSAEEMSAEEISAEEISAEEMSAEEMSAEEMSAEEINAEEINAEEANVADAQDDLEGFKAIVNEQSEIEDIEIDFEEGDRRSDRLEAEETLRVDHVGAESLDDDDLSDDDELSEDIELSEDGEPIGILSRLKQKITGR